MSGEETLKALNVNSYLSVGVVVLLISATLWINNSLGTVKNNQTLQAERSENNNKTMQIKFDAMGARIDAMSARIDGLVSRPEMEAKLSELRLEIMRATTNKLAR